FAAGDPAGAAEAARDALRGFRAVGNAGMYAMGAKAIAAFELAAGGDPRRVVRLASAADRLFDDLGGPLQMMALFGDPLEPARALLGEDDYARAAAEGRAMSPDEAVAYALQPGLATATESSGEADPP
ncbi:MAG TPA: hypothetical protein VMP67_02530, partial [Candidatus Limnocylindria bacterium]|nr:hypothetical protein [Candidatus Limnocylindria bacterium]